MAPVSRSARARPGAPSTHARSRPFLQEEKLRAMSMHSLNTLTSLRVVASVGALAAGIALFGVAVCDTPGYVK